MELTEQLSARELAYITALVGRDRQGAVGIAAYGILHDSCLTDVQAITYLHQFEVELRFRHDDTLVAAAEKLDEIVSRHF